VTSFFGIKVCVFFDFFQKRQRICAKFFSGLGENACLFQPALKSNALGL